MARVTQAPLSDGRGSRGKWLRPVSPAAVCRVCDALCVLPGLGDRSSPFVFPESCRRDPYTGRAENQLCFRRSLVLWFQLRGLRSDLFQSSLLLALVSFCSSVFRFLKVGAWIIDWDEVTFF